MNLLKPDDNFLLDMQGLSARMIICTRKSLKSDIKSGEFENKAVGERGTDEKVVTNRRQKWSQIE